MHERVKAGVHWEFNLYKCVSTTTGKVGEGLIVALVYHPSAGCQAHLLGVGKET